MFQTQLSPRELSGMFVVGDNKIPDFLWNGLKSLSSQSSVNTLTYKYLKNCFRQKLQLTDCNSKYMLTANYAGQLMYNT